MGIEAGGIYHVPQSLAAQYFLQKQGDPYGPLGLKSFVVLSGLLPTARIVVGIGPCDGTWVSPLPYQHRECSWGNHTSSIPSLEFGVKMQSRGCLTLGPDWLKPVVVFHPPGYGDRLHQWPRCQFTSKGVINRVFSCSVS